MHPYMHAGVHMQMEIIIGSIQIRVVEMKWINMHEVCRQIPFDLCDKVREALSGRCWLASKVIQATRKQHLFKEERFRNGAQGSCKTSILPCEAAQRRTLLIHSGIYRKWNLLHYPSLRRQIDV